MLMLETVIENAEDEIVFALRKQAVGSPRQVRSETKESVRLPLKADRCDLETAIDDMVERFPKTLEYLAK
jgi:hypothetical protein